MVRWERLNLQAVKLGLGARWSSLLGSLLAMSLGYADDPAQQAYIEGVPTRSFRCLSQENGEEERQQYQQ